MRKEEGEGSDKGGREWGRRGREARGQVSGVTDRLHKIMAAQRSTNVQPGPGPQRNVQSAERHSKQAHNG